MHQASLVEKQIQSLQVITCKDLFQTNQPQVPTFLASQTPGAPVCSHPHPREFLLLLELQTERNGRGFPLEFQTPLFSLLHYWVLKSHRSTV